MNQAEQDSINPDGGNITPIAESNWDRCIRHAKEMDKDKLIHDLIGQIDRMRKRSGIWRNQALWSLIGEATSHGSGYSSGIEYIYFTNYKKP